MQTEAHTTAQLINYSIEKEGERAKRSGEQEKRGVGGLKQRLCGRVQLSLQTAIIAQQQSLKSLRNQN